jgi:hypothetical protein
MAIDPGLDRKRVQGGGGVFATIASVPLIWAFVGLGAFADSVGNPHFTVGACQSLEGNSYVSVFEVDPAAGVVRVLGQTLVVP